MKTGNIIFAVVALVVAYVVYMKNPWNIMRR